MLSKQANRARGNFDVYGGPLSPVGIFHPCQMRRKKAISIQPILAKKQCCFPRCSICNKNVIYFTFFYVFGEFLCVIFLLFYSAFLARIYFLNLYIAILLYVIFVAAITALGCCWCLIASINPVFASTPWHFN